MDLGRAAVWALQAWAAAAAAATAVKKMPESPQCLQVVNGFNSTVFAYGQTSSGKTHTMKVGWVGGPGSSQLVVYLLVDGAPQAPLQTALHRRSFCSPAPLV